MSEAVQLEPLHCNACGASVPLGERDELQCPSCSAPVSVPETYRALRDARAAEAQTPRARALIASLGRRPPLFARAFAFFDSAWFLLFGLGFWIVLGCCVGVFAPPAIGRLLGVNTYDVWSEETETRVGMLVPLLSIVVGVILSGWAHKRVIVRSGLQSALAAGPPAHPGGPRTCRRCGAPLAVDERALGVRCLYCNSDNLVQMPEAWIAKVRGRAAQLGKEVAAAEVVWEEERRRLRNSLIARAITMAVLVGGPAALILAETSEEHPLSWDSIQAQQTSRILPTWSEELKHRLADEPCTPLPSWRIAATVAKSCGGGHCDHVEYIPLRRGEVVRVSSADLPEGSRAVLEVHELELLGDSFAPVESGAVSSKEIALLRPPRSGWYRLRTEIPGETPGTWSLCATVKDR